MNRRSSSGFTLLEALIAIVMILNIVARIIGRIFAPKTGR